MLKRNVSNLFSRTHPPNRVQVRPLTTLWLATPSQKSVPHHPSHGKTKKKSARTYGHFGSRFAHPTRAAKTSLRTHARPRTKERSKKKKKKKSFNRRGHAAERASDGQAEQLAYSEREEKNPGKRWKRKGGEGRWWCSASLRFCCDARGRAA